LNNAGGMTGKNWDELYAKMEKSFGGDIRVVFIKRQGNGTTLAKDLLRRGFGKVVAVGGDGTVNEVGKWLF
jgi:diacylglycerol kinase family enzyme